MAKRRPLRIPTGQALVDQAFDEQHRAWDDLLNDPTVSRSIISATLPNATVTKFKHGLGRPYVQCIPGCISGAASGGWIEDVTPAANKATEVWLKANGYGATITTVLTVS